MAWNYDDLTALGPEAKAQVVAQIGKKRQKVSKPSKMRNVPTYRGNIRFASKKEARRYDELMLMLKAGDIRDLKLQHDMTLQEAYTTPEGERIRAIRYRADFTYLRKTVDPWGHPRWLLTVEDVKGRKKRTGVYAMKKKMVYDKYKVVIQEV